jgi:hypothetical protein
VSVASLHHPTVPHLLTSFCSNLDSTIGESSVCCARLFAKWSF